LVVVVELRHPNTLNDNQLSWCVRLREGLWIRRPMPPLRGVNELK